MTEAGWAKTRPNQRERVLLNSDWPPRKSLDPMTSTPSATRSSLEARAGPIPQAAARTQYSEAGRSRRLSLLWWVFLANGSVLVVALLLLAFSPITIDTPIQTGQFAVLLAGFVVLVALNLLLLRRVLAPLFQLTEAMSSVDPDRPGRRLSGVDPGSAEAQALAAAFNACSTGWRAPGVKRRGRRSRRRRGSGSVWRGNSTTRSARP